MYIKVIDLTAGVRGFLRLARYSRYSGTVEGRPSYATHLRESWASLLLFYFILSYLFFGYFLRFSLLFSACMRTCACVRAPAGWLHMPHDNTGARVWN